jgi:hypothetical protein
LKSNKRDETGPREEDCPQLVNMDATIFKHIDYIWLKAPITVRFLLSPDYKEYEDPISIPGCVGELRCNDEYLESGGVGCHVRHLCDGTCWAAFEERCRADKRGGT